MADETIDIKINTIVDSAGGENSIAGIRKAIKALKSEALAVGESGAGFKQLTTRANELQDKLDDLKDSAKSLQGTGIEKLNSSFGLLKDSFANFDSDKLKTAFKGIGAAMNAIPIFLIIAGITKLLETFKVFEFITEAITKAIYAFTDALGLTNKAAEEKSKKLIENLQKEQKAVEARYDGEIAIAKATGKETGEIEEKKLKLVEASVASQVLSLQALQKEKGKLNDEEKKKYEELQVELIKASSERQAKELENEKAFREKLTSFRDLQTTIAEENAIAKMSDRQKEVYQITKKAQDQLEELDKKRVFNYQATGKQIEAQIAADALARKQIEETTAIETAKINKKYFVAKLSDTIKFNTDMTAADEEQAEKDIAILNKIEADKKEIKDKADAEALNASALAYSQEEKLYRDSLAKQKKLREEEFKQRVDDVNKYTQAIGAALQQVVGIFQAVSDLRKQELEQDTKERQAKLDADITNLETAKETELANTELTEEQKVAINNKYAQQEYELKLAEYTRSTELKKKAFEQDKKLKIAQTVIATITGAVAAFTGSLQSIPAPYGLIVGALSAAAVVAMGAIQVAQLNNQKFDAGSPPTPPKASVPSGGGVGPNNSLAAPEANLNKIGRNGQNGMNGNNSVEPVRAYVVSQDITSAQDKNAIIERRSSF